MIHKEIGALPQMMNGYQIQMDILREMGDFQSAFAYANKYYTFKDSLSNVENISKSQIWNQRLHKLKVISLFPI